MSETSLTYELTNDQQEILLGIMVNGNFRKREVPYSVYSIEGENFNATLYAKEKHGKRKLCIRAAARRSSSSSSSSRRASCRSPSATRRS